MTYGSGLVMEARVPSRREIAVAVLVVSAAMAVKTTQLQQQAKVMDQMSACAGPGLVGDVQPGGVDGFELVGFTVREVPQGCAGKTGLVQVQRSGGQPPAVASGPVSVGSRWVLSDPVPAGQFITYRVGVSGPDVAANG